MTRVLLTDERSIARRVRYARETAALKEQLQAHREARRRANRAYYDRKRAENEAYVERMKAGTV